LGKQSLCNGTGKRGERKRGRGKKKEKFLHISSSRSAFDFHDHLIGRKKGKKKKREKLNLLCRLWRTQSATSRGGRGKKKEGRKSLFSPPRVSTRREKRRGRGRDEEKKEGGNYRYSSTSSIVA